MTALFFPIFGHYTPVPDGLGRDGFALPEEGVPAQWASIRLGKSTAQGPVLRRWRDGRVTVDGGGREITGYPVASGGAARGVARGASWWRRLTA
ncbi:MAG: hypothetical protein Q4G26_11575 [Paracoccus sp. (in: a-proteobacteria)]|nr:hypothetical protein [Paracoccus sp. (in: a-proteobacteria)]